ncbi:MAG: class I SAM-dependent methyltransferase [Proteobacteria bacterium]|nr:class I SAM-dependent methyltransferase [Pseudomonadota bacterium]
MHDDIATLPRAVEPPSSALESPKTGRSIVLSVVDRVLRRMSIGRLHLTLPSGASAVVGCPSTSAEADVQIASYAALWKIGRRGVLGFAESYMDGDIETSDLKALFELYYANEPALTRALPRFNLTPGVDRGFHVSRSNTRDGSRRNIADHYDLGNAFYRLWLDPSMLYSSGYYADGAETLEEAQARKVALILEGLELRGGESLLEIGCGWGALAAACARAGANVKAITISAEQLAGARERVASANLSSRVDLSFEDYRDTTGRFDRLVSIEMIEAVGEEHWPLFFTTIADRLNPGGEAVIQAITIREDAFDGYRRNPDFIQRYIFPGGMLPTVDLMRRHAEASGLGFETIERFGASYALTLAEWRCRFEAAWPSIAKLGFDERFRRMWLYYLTYCEIGFENGLIDVGLYRFRKAA